MNHFDYTAQRAAYRDLLSQIAACLPDEWQLAPDEHESYSSMWIWQRLTFGRYQMHVKSEGDRIAVSAIWPLREGHSYRPNGSPRITVSQKRTPQAIAADIERRFVGEYKPLFDEQLAKSYTQRQKEQRHTDAMHRAEQALDGEYDRKRYVNGFYHRGDKGAVIGKKALVTFNGNQYRISFEDVPPDQAEMLLACWRTIYASWKLEQQPDA